MPVPSPRVRGKNKETEQKYVQRCMKFFSGEDTDLEQKQQLAICYDKYRKARKKKVRANTKRPKDLVRELRKLAEHFNSKRL